MYMHKCKFYLFSSEISELSQVIFPQTTALLVYIIFEAYPKFYSTAFCMYSMSLSVAEAAINCTSAVLWLIFE